MTGVPATHMALLEQITDPTQVALGELREAVAELVGDIRKLKKAVGSDGLAAKDWLCYLAQDVDEAAERLAAVLETRWSK